MARKKVYRVKPGPDFKTERTGRYYELVPEVLEKHFGRRPSRNTLYKYLTRGYPITRGGPYVQMPVYSALKRTMTTEEAMERFVTMVRKLERDYQVVGAA